MTKELSALLRKKSWTGDEIGKAIVYSLVDAHRQALEGVVNPSPVFPPDQLQLMIGSLSDPAQLRRYNSYVGLQNWLIQYQAVSTAYYNQVAGELDVADCVLDTALAVETDLRLLGELPVPLSRKECQAILEGGELAVPLDGSGEKPEVVLQTSVMCGLEQYTALNPLRERAASRARERRKALESGYYYVKGYDQSIALIAEYLAMPEFLIFQLNAGAIEERMREMEKKAAGLEERIVKEKRGKAETRQAKLDALRQYFAPFDWAGLEIPAGAVKEAKALLADNLRAFDRQDSSFISILTSREGRS